MSERLTTTLTASLPTAQPLHRALTHLLTEWLPTMQDTLTHFLSGFELGAFSYFAVAFIWFAFNRSQATPAAAAPAIAPAAVGALDTAKLANGFPPFEALGTSSAAVNQQSHAANRAHEQASSAARLKAKATI